MDRDDLYRELLTQASKLHDDTLSALTKQARFLAWSEDGVSGLERTYLEYPELREIVEQRQQLLADFWPEADVKVAWDQDYCGLDGMVFITACTGLDVEAANEKQDEFEKAHGFSPHPRLCETIGFR